MTQPISRRQSLRRLGAGTALVAAPLLAQAQGGKTMRIVVPFPPGGSTDLLARRIGEKLSVAFGQTGDRGEPGRRGRHGGGRLRGQVRARRHTRC
ncbi:MAG: hypothetical protein QM777_07250 [Pseudorhodoferax sp.]